MNRSWRFQNIISLITTGVVLVPLVFTGLLLWFLLSPGLERQQMQNQITLAKAISEQINGYLGNGVKELELFASYLSEVGDSVESSTLNEFARLTDVFEVVYLVDESGVVQHAGVPPSSSILSDNLIQLDISRMDHFQNIRSVMVSEWSNAFLSSASGELVVAFSMDIPEVTTYRYLIAELGINSLPDLLADIQSSSGLTVMILDEAYQLIGHPDKTLSRQQMNLSQLGTLATDTFHHDQVNQFEFLEKQYYGALISIDDPTWKIIVATPEEQFWSLLFIALRSIAISLVLGAVLVVILSSWVAKSSSRKFATYRTVSDQLAQGNYEFTPPVSTIVELQDFTENLVRTGQAIAQREAQLAKINAELESRVEDRTRDLTQVNENLSETLATLQHAQEELVESGKLAALGSLVAGVAHELNTPIGVSVTASSSVTDDAKTLRNAFEDGTLSKSKLEAGISHIIEGSELISRNLSRAADLIMSFKQVSADQSSDKRRTFSLDDLINDVLATMRPKYKGQAFQFEFTKNTAMELESYPGSLIQVLTNLIDNACVHGYKNTREGRIEISTTAANKRSVTIEIRDFGMGIPEANRSRIFEPFFTTRHGSGGTGLGLNIVHSIIEKILGGQVKVESTINEGTAFVVTIPVKAPKNVSDTAHLVNS